MERSGDSYLFDVFDSVAEIESAYAPMSKRTHEHA